MTHPDPFPPPPPRQAIKEIIGTYEDIPAPDMNTGGWPRGGGGADGRQSPRGTERGGPPRVPHAPIGSTYSASAARTSHDTHICGASVPPVPPDAKVMAWFFDEYSKYKGFSPGVVTGKVRVPGRRGRGATGAAGEWAAAVVVVAGATAWRWKARRQHVGCCYLSVPSMMPLTPPSLPPPARVPARLAGSRVGHWARHHVRHPGAAQGWHGGQRGGGQEDTK